MKNLEYSQINEIYVVAQVNETESDHKKALNESKTKLVYKEKQIAVETCRILNKHSSQPGYKWVACKAHVYTDSRLHLDNAKII